MRELAPMRTFDAIAKQNPRQSKSASRTVNKMMPEATGKSDAYTMVDDTSPKKTKHSTTTHNGSATRETQAKTRHIGEARKACSAIRIHGTAVAEVSCGLCQRFENASKSQSPGKNVALEAEALLICIFFGWENVYCVLCKCE